MERVVLVGFMGSGKSTVGPEVARLLGFDFRDMDTWIEERTGLSVQRLFEDRGEAAFRAEELALAQEIRGLQRLVVAAGGGAWAQPATRTALQHRALTVYLRCELPTLLDRIPMDGSRPLAVSRERIAHLFAEREVCYRLAGFEVDASAPPDAVARNIVSAYWEREKRA